MDRLFDIGLKLLVIAAYLALYAIRAVFAAKNARLDYRTIDSGRNSRVEGSLVYWGTAAAGIILPLGLVASFLLPLLDVLPL